MARDPDTDPTRCAPERPGTPGASRDYRVIRDTWLTPESAARYRAQRAPAAYGRYHREDAIARGWLGLLRPGARVLDVPCGTGRFRSTVAELGFAYVGGDISPAMVQEARQGPGPAPALVLADSTRLPFRDGSFDCVLVWRLLHHVGDVPTRRAILTEAARVSRDMVLVSFHHSWSFTAVRKAVQRGLSGRPLRGKTITHWQLAREARTCGLDVQETRSFGKYRSINWFACLRRSTRTVEA